MATASGFRKGHHVCGHAPVIRNAFARFYHHVFRKTAIHMRIGTRCPLSASGRTQIFDGRKGTSSLCCRGWLQPSGPLSESLPAGFADHAQQTHVVLHQLTRDGMRAAMLMVMTSGHRCAAGDNFTTTSCSLCSVCVIPRASFRMG